MPTELIGHARALETEVYHLRLAIAEQRRMNAELVEACEVALLHVNPKAPTAELLRSAILKAKP